MYLKHALLQNCHGCKTNFEHTGLHKHHCRACGEGVCNPCSMHQMPVPARGWNYPVRVCNSCKDILSKKRDARPGKQLILFWNSHSRQFAHFSHYLFNLPMKSCDVRAFKQQKSIKSIQNKKMLFNQLQFHLQARTTVTIRMIKIFVYENMVKLFTILCQR